MKRLFLALLALSVLSFLFFLILSPAGYLYDVALQLGLFFLAMYFLWKKDLAATLKGIGFPGNLKDTLLYTVGGLFAVFGVLLLLSLAAYLLGVNDEAKVSQTISGLPLYLLVLAVIFAPIIEELLFRAVLVPRAGVVLSALVFGLLHFGYGSIVEVVGVVLVGLILGLVFRSSKSITPCILIHLIYNVVSITVMKLVT
jgi:membrane protease YdiL (CAAX protease family)